MTILDDLASLIWKVSLVGFRYIVRVGNLIMLRSRCRQLQRRLGCLPVAFCSECSYGVKGMPTRHRHLDEIWHHLVVDIFFSENNAHSQLLILQKKNQPHVIGCWYLVLFGVMCGCWYINGKFASGFDLGFMVASCPSCNCQGNSKYGGCQFGGLTVWTQFAGLCTMY